MLSDRDILRKVASLRKSRGSIYAPLKYFRGLKTLSGVERRYEKMLRRDYKPFPTDRGVKTRRSSYTQRFRRKYGDKIRTIPQISRATGVPIEVLQQVYRRGMAAWRTGHRPGASQQAWAWARVYSYVMKGKTYYTADKNLHS
jgi:hypothetical protein